MANVRIEGNYFDGSVRDKQGDVISGIHLTIRNRGGSVQHFYHFRLGFLVPLVKARNGLVTKIDNGNVFVRSCALMDPLLAQLGLPGLVIIDAVEHAAWTKERFDVEKANNLMFVSVDGYGMRSRYCFATFESAKSQIFFHLRGKICQEIRVIRASARGNGPRIVIIDRLPPHEFDSTKECENKTAGAQRRSITNMEEVRSAVTPGYSHLRTY